MTKSIEDKNRNIDSISSADILENTIREQMPEILDIFDKVKRGELRVYYNPTNIPIPIPIVSKIQEISMFENEETEVKIDGEVFFKSVTRVRKSVYDVVIQFGDSFSLIINSDENIGTLDINMSKNLRSINSDYNFLIAFSKNFTFEIFGHQLSFGALKNTELDINTIKDDLFKLANVVKLFNKLKLNNT